jgi:uncharacterized protein (DUF433 family)
MWIPLEPWQIAQLGRLSTIDPERIESALNALWKDRPDLLEQVTIAGVASGDIPLEVAAHRLALSEAVIEQQVADFNRRSFRRCSLVICESGVAKLADGGIPVWEVVRVYRKLGSIERLQKAFSGASSEALQSALAYAQTNSDEIDHQIEKYEEMVERRRAEYPYAQ